MQKVSVVILNYNGKNWLEKFLPNVLENTTYPNAEIIVADNASTDDSIPFLQASFPSVKIVQNSVNTGYAGGYNEALQHIKSNYYVLLNSDVEVTESWIEPVIERFIPVPAGEQQQLLRLLHPSTNLQPF